MTNDTNDFKRSAAIADIAKRELDIETLETRGRDQFDFHDCGVTSIKRALEAAYDAGRKQRRPARTKCPACGRTVEITQVT